MTCGCRSHNGFLTAKGLAETAQLELMSAEGLTRSVQCVSVDIPGSVSGLRRDEINVEYDQMSESDLREVLSHG